MRQILIDCNQISSVKALHIYLQHVMDLPEYSGRILDALHDVLTEIAQPTELILNASEPQLSDEMKGFVPRLVRVLKDAAQENPALILTGERFS